MSRFYSIVFLLVVHTMLLAQKQVVFDFKNTLIDTSGKFPALQVLGLPGVFVNDTLHELGNRLKTVYQFDINSGLSFDNNSAGRFIATDYSIELYFKFEIYNSWKRVVDFKNKKADTGPYLYFRKAGFYKDITEEIPHLRPGEWLYYVITRNSGSQKVNIYVDGKQVISFTDNNGEGVIDQDNKLNLFHDNHSMGNEASAGAIAMLKIHSRTLSDGDVAAKFQELPRMFDVLNTRKLPKILKPVTVKGNIYDERNGAPIPASMHFQQPADSAFVTDINNNAITGDYNYPLPAGRYYTVTVSSKGFMDVTDIVDLTTIADPGKPVVKDIALSRMIVGKTIPLNKITFGQSAYQLLPASYTELDKLAELMLEHKNMEIYLHGHTDNQGDPRLNIELSEKRVNAVKEYLISKGVNGHHIKGKGHGGARPIASNAVEATRKLNRRVEMTILRF